jgi:hypothetical protein
MRLPSHIILDTNCGKHQKSSKYWVTSLSEDNNNTPVFVNHKILMDKLGYDTFLNYAVNKKNVFLIGKYTTFEISTNSINVYEYLYMGSYMLGWTQNTLNTTTNVNFLRKERVYTKLKYSRSPAYDIVSGGAAALLAGLFGFLISEKFGMELVDSGDFYYLFMYLVFLAFSVRPLLIVSSSGRSFLGLVSLKRMLEFYITIIVIFFKRIE